ncbi:polyketide synthase, partial [Moniliophthora roreri]
MHLAVQAVRNGECDQAVVAGVNILLSPLETASFSQLGVLGPDGISKAFDEDANGYARGDVVSAVVIKRHDLAVRDYDRILATLVGTALTSCGSLMGSLTTPSPDAQTKAIRNAYADAGLTPNQADFVELHGTGTIVGDQYEANTAGACFSDGRDGREIVIGSVKSNVGHGEMGAYMSSLVK